MQAKRVNDGLSPFSNVHWQARETNSKQWFIFFSLPTTSAWQEDCKVNHQFYTENTTDDIWIFFFTWSFKDTTRRKRLGPDMLDGDCRERSQHWWFDVQVWRWWGKPIQARLCCTNGRMKEMHTLYTFPKAPSPSSPMTAHTSSGFTSLRTCSYCFFFFSAPNLNIFRKLKNDIAKSIKLKKQCT